METFIQGRKEDHLRINLEKDVTSHVSTGFERFDFVHQALPELDYATVSTEQTFLGKQLGAPLLISCMTGGTPRAQEINARLARSAQNHKICMGLGSMRVLLRDPSLLPTFQVRKLAPDCLLLANMGAVQLQDGWTPEDIHFLIESVEADALVLHLNPLQEVLQPEGDRNWHRLLDQIEQVIQKISVPVVVKEVGYGLSRRVIRCLRDVGAAALDVSGAGGTSWSQVEAYRSPTSLQQRVASSFTGWGIPTALSLQWAKETAPHLPLIASGGVYSGIHMAKALYLGADMCGVARPLLVAAAHSQEALDEEVALLIEQLKVVLFCTASANISALRQAEILPASPAPPPLSKS